MIETKKIRFLLSKIFVMKAKIKEQFRGRVLYLILGLNILIYLVISLIRLQFDRYGSIESVIVGNNFLGLETLIPIFLIFLYFLGFKNIEKFNFKILIWGYLIFALILLLTPVLNSTDVYTYTMRGRVLSVYQHNPYIDPVASFPQDPFLKFTCPAWLHLTENYGPLWSMTSAFLSKMGSNIVDFTFFLFKFWAFIGSSLVLLLIYKISKISFPDNVKKNFFLYAWNPFILIEFANNAHNDIWMIFFGLLAFYFYCKKKDVLIIPALVLAGAIKYVFWALIPIFLIFLYKQHRIKLKTIFISGLISLFLIAIVFLPLINNLESLKGLLWQSELLSKPFNIYNPLLIIFTLFILLTQLVSGQYYPTINLLSSGLLVTRIIFVVSYIRQLFVGKNLINNIVISLILFVMLVPASILPWYIIWWLPFLILQTRWEPVIFWSLIGLLSYSLLYSVSLTFLIIIGSYFLISKLTKSKLAESILI